MRIGRLSFIAAVLAAVLAAGVSKAGAAGPKIAVIDVARILNESEAGKAAKKKLEARFEELQKAVEAKKAEAQKVREELEKMKVLVDKGKGKIKEKEDLFAAKVADYEKTRQESEKEMQGRQAEMGRDILKVIESKVLAIVAEEKIELLLDSAQANVVLHFSPALDITAKVLEQVNKADGGAKEATGGK